MKPRSRTPRALLFVLTAALALLAVRPAAAATVNITWTLFPSSGGVPIGNTTIELVVGDTIEWNVQLGHNLLEMANENTYNTCNFIFSTLIANGPTVVQTTYDTPGTHYYACNVALGSHCSSFAMRVAVNVSEAPPVPLPSAWPAAAAGALALAGLAALRSRRRAQAPS